MVQEGNAVVIYGHDVIGGSHVWPSSGTAVTNGGTGGSGCNGIESANHYGTINNYTTQGITSSGEAVVIDCSALDNKSSITLEFLFQWDSNTGSTAYFFGKSSDFYVKYQKSGDTLTIHRGTQTPILWWYNYSYEEWTYHPGITVSGGWYDLQISWGNSDSTPLVKCNDVVKTALSHHEHSGDDTWRDDDDSNVKVMNSSGQNEAVKGVIGVFRFHSAALSDANLHENYVADWQHVWSTLTYNQPAPPPPSAASAALPPSSITSLPNTWFESDVPGGTGSVFSHGVDISQSTLQIAGNATASVLTPTRITSARFSDVPPMPKFTLTRIVPNKFILNPIVEEEQQ